MGRVAKKAPETPKVVEEIQTITQTRAKRTPKPNPRYVNESLVATPKIILETESNGSTDIEEKLPESKIVKSTAKVSASKQVVAKTPAGKAQAAAKAIKKQKIEFDDDEKTKDADEVPLPSPTPRTTRSGKFNEKESEIKVGEESVAIVDVSSIISNQDVAAKEESPKVTRGSAGRKRQAEALAVIEIKDESPKKKKEEEKTSLITARKSYMPATPANKAKPPVVESKSEPKKENEKVEPVTEEEKEEPANNLANSMKTRRSIAAQAPTEIPDKKPKVEVKTSPVGAALAKTIEPKKLPVIARKEPITKIITPNTAQKIVTATTVDAKPAPRILNTMVTPKGAKESPIVKLAGDGSDRKVFSIEMSDGSVVEKKPAIVKSPIKSSPQISVKENIAINKPQPAALLKNTLESELNRMKASANYVKQRQSIPNIRSPAVVSHVQANSNATPPGARRITKFESWYVIDVRDDHIQSPLKHTHSFSLIHMGNNIKEIQMPSSAWEYKITVQKRVKKMNEDEVYHGEPTDKIPESEKHNYEPNCILFKRCHKDSSPRVIIDRSIMFKADSYAITMNGKQCHLLGAPSEINSLEDIEILLQIIDSSSLSHSCVETNC